MPEIKLDIGCGGRGSRQEGFIGIDIWPKPPNNPNPYYRLDFINEPLPWADNTVDEAIALHIIEHLSRGDGPKLISIAMRLLKIGAKLTVSCPDLMLLCSAYMHDNKKFLEQKHLNGGKEIWPGKTMADRLNWAVHQDSHKWSYDLDTLIYVAKSVGCKNIRPLEIGEKYSTRPKHECGIVITK